MTVTVIRDPRSTITLRANEGSNPSLEVDGNGWSHTWFGAGGTGVNGRGSGYAFVGTGSIYKLWNGTPSGTVEDAGFEYLHTLWTAGQTKVAQARMYCSNIAVQVACKLRYLDSSGNLIAQDVGPTTFVTAGTAWSTVSATGTAPPGTAKVAIWFVLMASGNKPGQNTVLSLDACLIEPGGSVYDYFSGDTYPNGYGELSTVWEGPANNSRSLLKSLDPAERWSPYLVEGYEHVRPNRNVIVQLASGGVAVQQRDPGLRRGTLRYLFGSNTDRPAARAQALSAEAQHRKRGVFSYYDSDLPELQMRYVVAGDIRCYSEFWTWRLEVPYQEVP